MITGSFLSLRGHILVRIVGGHVLIRKNNPSRAWVYSMGQGGASDEIGSEEVMSPRRLAVLAALCGTVVLAGWVAAGLLGFGSPRIENTGAPTEGSRATSATAGAEPIDAPQATAMGEDGVSVTDVAIVDAALPGPRPMPPPETPAVQVASASTPDP
ncbi:MAG TPA: hypothetical protein VF901_28590, partial [Bradyrhizobium sp.]